MLKYFSISQAAKASNLTSETLRHYDRIGLIKPSKIDKWTKYRYYTEQDIVRLSTIRALQIMDLTLPEIKRVMEYNDLEKIVAFFNEAEKKADNKIKALKYSKSKIKLAKMDYEKKLQDKQNLDGVFIKTFPSRVIMLSNSLESPTLKNFWNYLSHFYGSIPQALVKSFSFEDLAGIYTENGLSKLFAVCTSYTQISSLKELPAGKYLCANCSEENREDVLKKLINRARIEYNTNPAFTLQIIVVTGILHWNYQIQVYIGQ